jgi:hypothetical protein
MNVSQMAGEISSGRVRVVAPKSIAPLRLLRCDGHGGRFPVRWHVVYTDGEVNKLAWTTKRDAIAQASFAVPYHRQGTKEVCNVGGANQGGNPGGVQ